MYWETDDMTIAEAWELEHELNDDPATIGKCFAGTGMFWALSLGAKLEDLRVNGQYSDLAIELMGKQDDMLKQYVQKFKAYWNV
jgi:hypothetical protein